MLGLISCAKGTLRNDFRESPLDNNYHSAEIVVQGQRHFGVASMKADENQPFSFSVVGIHRGVIRVKSNACRIDELRTYDSTDEVSFKFKLRGDRCLLDIFVEPQFTLKESDGVKWRGLSGVLLVRANAFMIAARQIQSDEVYSLSFDLLERTTLTVVGCGFRYSGVHDKGEATLDIESSFDYDDKICVLDGLMKSSSSSKSFSILLSRYSSLVNRLPTPAFSFGGSDFGVVVDRSVSLMSFQGQDVFDIEHRFGVDISKPKVFRAFTAKGRYLFCNILSSSEVRCLN